MIVTIVPDAAKGFMIICRDDSGNTIERISVTDVFIEGNQESWPKMEIKSKNVLRLSL